MIKQKMLYILQGEDVEFLPPHTNARSIKKSSVGKYSMALAYY